MTQPEANWPPCSVKEAHELSGMPKEYGDLLLHQLVQHAEGELIGAEDYLTLFYPIAPDAFEKRVCCERASEELDHFIRAADILADIGYDAQPMLNRSIAKRQHYKTEGVEKVDTWLKRGLFSFIGEAAVLSMIEEMALSSYRPIAEMTRQVLIDEHVHVAHGRRIVEQQIKVLGASAVQPEFEIAWAMSLDLFGRSDSERSAAYLKWGLRRLSNQAARERYIEKMTPTLSLLGLSVPKNHALRKFL